MKTYASKSFDYSLCELFKPCFQEIVDKPQLFIEGASAKDVTQGQLGNCWFVAACATLAGVKELWHKVTWNYLVLQLHTKLKTEIGFFFFLLSNLSDFSVLIVLI